MKRVFLFALALGCAFAGNAQAARYKVLKDFCDRGLLCVDGEGPFSTPVSDGAGHYFGTTFVGGNGGGAVYEMSLDGGRWTYQRIHLFCDKQPDCVDGLTPYGRLIIDTSGNLYGMTVAGGANRKGVVFELMPHGGDWKYRKLHDFCAQANCTDGASPQYEGLSYKGAASGAAYDGVSPLYGTTEAGGANNGGTVFALTRQRHGWSYEDIFDFCAADECDSGTSPFASVLVDSQGNLFGTTLDGGLYGHGAVFELSPDGAGWSETVIHHFCAQTNCPDGANPFAPLVMNGAGDLFGTTADGGANNSGAVFRLHKVGKRFRLFTLHSFCSQAQCGDGSIPYAGLTIDADGRLFGATIQGGAQSLGVLFMLSGKYLTDFTTLVDFGGTQSPGGSQPYGPPAVDATGTLYGVTLTGGTNNNGVFYRLKP